MKTFDDNEGRTWDVEVNVAAIKRVRDLCNVDLYDAGDAEKSTLARLATDPILLVDVIWVLCQRQAEHRAVSDEEFGRAMAGDAIERATEALLEEIVNFTPNPKDRERMGKVVAKMKAYLDRTREFLGKKTDDPRLDRALESELRKFDDSFGSLLASLASTPDH